MKKVVLILLLALSGISWGQSVISGTITDSSGITWAGATITATFAPTPGVPGIYTYNGSFFRKYWTTVADTTGLFNITLPENTNITPARSQWFFTVCPNATSACSSFNYSVQGPADISNLVTANLTPTTVNATPIPLSYGTGPVKQIPLNQGGFIFDTISKTPKYYDGSSWNSFGGGGSVPAGTVHQLQFNNGTVFGASLATVDSSGNFITPGTSNVSGLSSIASQYLFGTQSLCPQHGTNEIGTDCEKNLAIITATPVSGAGFNSRSSRIVDSHLIVQGPGYYRGNQGDINTLAGYGYSGANLAKQYIESYAQGIAAAMTTQLDLHAANDGQGHYIYVNPQGGFLHIGDEGVYGQGVGIRDTINYYVGTLVNSDSTNTILTASNQNSGRISSVLNGGILIDTSSNGLACQLDGTSTVAVGFLRSLGVTGCTLPLTTAWATLPNIITPGTDANVTTTTTVVATLQPIGGSTPAFPVGTSICVIASAFGAFEPVSVTATAASGTSQQVTIPLLDSYLSSGIPPILACGGPANLFISSDADLTFSGMRTTYPVFMALDSSHIIAGKVIQGGWALQFPDTGAEAWALSGANSAFHLYPGAKILSSNIVVSNNSAGDPVYSTQPFSVSVHSPFSIGDNIESPNAMSTFYTAYSSIGNVLQSPGLSNVPSHGLNMDWSGKGIGMGFNMINLSNYEPVTSYDVGGASIYILPPTLMNTYGTWANDFHFSSIPTKSVMDFDYCNAPGDVSGNVVKPLFWMPNTIAHHAGMLAWNCTTNTFYTDVNFQADTIVSRLGQVTDTLSIGPVGAGYGIVTTAFDSSPKGYGGAHFGSVNPWLDIRAVDVLDDHLTAGQCVIGVTSGSSVKLGSTPCGSTASMISNSISLNSDGIGSITLTGTYSTSKPYPVCSDATITPSGSRAFTVCYATLSGTTATITFSGTPNGTINYQVVSSN